MAVFSFNMELSPRPSKVSGLYKINIRITGNRVHQRVMTPYTVRSRDEFNGKSNQLRGKSPEVRAINQSVEGWIRDTEKFIEKYNAAVHQGGEHDMLSLAKVHAFLEGIVTGVPERMRAKASQHEEAWKSDFVAFCQHCFATGKYRSEHTRLSRKRGVDLFVEFGAGKPMPFYLVNRMQLLSYRDWLRKEKQLLDSSVNVMIHVLRVYYSMAQERELIPSGDGLPNPFANLKLNKKSKKKQPLTYEDLKGLLELKMTNRVQLRARAAFLFSYGAQGMRIGDLLMLKNGDLNGNRLVYRMSKNDKFRSLLLLDIALEAIRPYHRPELPDEYLFPYFSLKDNLTDKAYLATRINCCNSAIYNALKRVRKQAGLSRPLSMHVARHTIAEHLFRSTGNLRAVQNVLGHSKSVTTEKYLNQMETEVMDEVMQAFNRDHALKK